MFSSEINLRLGEIGITKSSNFANTHRYLLCDVTFQTTIAKFTEKMQAKVHKIDMEMTNRMHKSTW